MRAQNPFARRRGPSAAPFGPPPATTALVDLERRREQLNARFAELQWDLGGLAYEMAIRDHVRVDLLVERAAALQTVDAELAEVERILRTDQTGASGACPTCASPHSSGAVFCWQCGSALLAPAAAAG
ncbi:hypothetical protein NBH00_16810 [Paraconexibacter antarcticus]|uniref:Zinc ribbon domain-containing protein n=1 Tax=Paraconexibacter antarcticus TaxID=2949664 RepID=A0ABY5DQ24_9ACTN|nr:hypothetical protein [Paraconexibacter antarcticus]UTI63014.1 hypothetical protein NBH00_16810 [Paraconexibacter antarcticus]